jgi:rubrerythrin
MNVDNIAPPHRAAPASLDEFMAQAIAMEYEAAGRYDELADVMETHNNVAVASLFRTMASIERKHATQLLAQMSWTQAPEVTPWWGSPAAEGPETTPLGEVHYLMQPYHALVLAHASEQRAVEFFRMLAHSTSDVNVRRAALALAAEEREHVALVEQWLAKVSMPSPDWADDPDPPRYSD